MRRIIAVLVLSGVALTAWQRVRRSRGTGRPIVPGKRSIPAAATTGIGTGFTSMVANAAGALMALYCSSSGWR